MASSNELISKAKNIGKHAAESAHVTGRASRISADTHHHPGDDTGRLVLAAYREFGSSAVRSIVEAYQGGYNNQAAEQGDPVIRMVQIKNGIGYALPGATDSEIEHIADSL